MAKYVDGFVLPIKRKNIPAYRRMAKLASKVWMEHGALQYVECAGDDLNIPKVKSFLKLAGAKSGETVVFAWISYRSRAHRDAVNKKVMVDPRLSTMMTGAMPFDVTQMAYSGFTVLVSADRR